MKETIAAMDFRATIDKFEHDPVVYGDNAVWIRLGSEESILYCKALRMMNTELK